MLLNPVGPRDFSRASAENLAAAWPVVLLAGAVSLVLGVCVLAIDWTVSSLAFFVGVLFVFQGLVYVTARPLDGSPRSVGIVVGLLGAAGGVAIMVWPEISLLTLGLVAGCWLVVRGVLNVAGAVAQRHVRHWWLVLALGLVEIPIGIWAMRRPGITLALLITLLGVWQIVVGLWQILIALELRRLPDSLGPPGTTSESELRPRPA